ncbi:uncharacterized protein LOC128234133 [Mya arenaria]|uniref:uncharacterized protein LOC128234133 n=1 Tax=Mya arenaria TaxID=6604 RepID=UPI0022E3A05B|nr:uncharacterized protein LOC128234133 [Mya arenaria]
MEAKKICFSFVILELSIYFVDTLQISHTSSKVGQSSVIQCTSDNGNNMDWVVDGSTVTSCSGTTPNNCVPPCAECSSVIGSPAATFSYTISSVGYTHCIKYGCQEDTTGLLSEFSLEVTDFSVDNSTAVLNPQEPTANTDGNVSITTPCIFPTSSDAITINWYMVFVNKANQVELLDASNADIQSYSETDTTGCSTCSTKSAGKVTVGVTYKAPSSNGDEIKLQVEIIHADYTDHLYYTFDQSYYLPVTTTPHPVCDCCCCDNRPKRDGACGTVLGVCICVMAVLVICFYKGFSSKHLEGKIFKLILAIFCLIAALTGLILSAICLSKECCSCSGDSCQARNCFKGDTIAGFVMTVLSVLGTVIVIILIFLITGESAGNRRDPERPSRGNTRGAGVSVPNNPPNDTHSAGSLVSRADIYPSLESDRTSNAPLRAQPLPPVGAQGHGRGLSANYRDGMDDMPMVGGQKKSLPPIEANSGEDAEVRKRKKKKKKTKGNDDMELSNRGDKSD